jgi:uncharacterized protein (DUF4415 family)
LRSDVGSTPIFSPLISQDEGEARDFLAARRWPDGRGPQKAPTKEMISIRLSRKVLDYFRGTGAGHLPRPKKVA